MFSTLGCDHLKDTSVALVLVTSRSLGVTSGSDVTPVTGVVVLVVRDQVVVVVDDVVASGVLEIGSCNIRQS